MLTAPSETASARGLELFARARLRPPSGIWSQRWSPPRRIIDLIWYGCLLAAIIYSIATAGTLRRQGDVPGRSRAGSEQRRSDACCACCCWSSLATLIWVPIGVAVGLRPKLAEKVQPVAQFLAAFPANLLFPLAVFLIVRFHLAPKIWLTPADDPGHAVVHPVQRHRRRQRVSERSARGRRRAAVSAAARWWREVMLPGIFPVLRHRRHHRLRRRVECEHRLRGGQLGTRPSSAPRVWARISRR